MGRQDVEARGLHHRLTNGSHGWNGAEQGPGETSLRAGVKPAGRRRRLSSTSLVFETNAPTALRPGGQKVVVLSCCLRSPLCVTVSLLRLTPHTAFIHARSLSLSLCSLSFQSLPLSSFALCHGSGLQRSHPIKINMERISGWWGGGKVAPHSFLSSSLHLLDDEETPTASSGSACRRQLKAAVCWPSACGRTP